MGSSFWRGYKADEIVIPSIMITGHGDISMAVKAMQAGVRDFLEKPFSHQDLVASIRRTLEKPRSPAHR